MSSFDEHTRAGLAAMEERRMAEAIAAFEAAVALEPSRPDINNLLGIARLTSGDAAGAVGSLRTAVRLAQPHTDDEVQPMKRGFSLNLARALSALDEVREARRVLEAAVATWPTEGEPRLHLGQLLLGACELTDGKAVYRGLAQLPAADEETRAAATALVDCIETFERSEHDGSLFLRAHRDSYVSYFDEIAAGQVQAGWYAEAARMARGADGEPRPLLADGARPYAMSRVDLVDPSNGEVATVYSDREPMIVRLNGFEPLAETDVLFPWEDAAFPVWVSSRCPWHWLQVIIELRASDEPIARVDPVVGAWYLAGYNGDFGTADAGRFHYVTDPEPIGPRAVSYTVDLGRAGFEAISALLRALDVLHASAPIARVVFGFGRLSR